MSLERMNGITRYLPKTGEIFITDGVQGMRRAVQGLKMIDPLAGVYTFEEITLQSGDCAMTRLELSLKRAMDGSSRSVVVLNGEVIEVAGFGKKLSDAEVELYTGFLSRNFMECDVFTPITGRSKY